MRPAVPYFAYYACPHRVIERSDARRADDWNYEVHELWITHGPLEGLKAAHRDPHHCMQPRQLEMLYDEPMLRLHHVSNSQIAKRRSVSGIRIRR